jgi:hypothetical protein
VCFVGLVLAGRSLAQRENGSANPICKITYKQLASKKVKKYKTKQKKRALDPVWNEVFQLYVHAVIRQQSVVVVVQIVVVVVQIVAVVVLVSNTVPGLQ